MKKNRQTPHVRITRRCHISFWSLPTFGPRLKHCPKRCASHRVPNCDIRAWLVVILSCFWAHLVRPRNFFKSHFLTSLYCIVYQFFGGKLSGCPVTIVTSGGTCWPLYMAEITGTNPPCRERIFRCPQIVATDGDGNRTSCVGAIFKKPWKRGISHSNTYQWGPKNSSQIIFTTSPGSFFLLESYCLPFNPASSTGSWKVVMVACFGSNFLLEFFFLGPKHPNP